MVRNVREHGVEVRPVDVNTSGWDCTLEKTAGGLSHFSGDCPNFRLGGAPTEGWSGTVPLGATKGDRHIFRPSGVHRMQGEMGRKMSQSPAIRLGFRMLQGMIGRPRRANRTSPRGPAFCLDRRLSRRTGLGRAAVVRLAKAGTFGSLGLDRRGALWHALAQEPCDLPLFAGLSSDDGPAVGLPRMSAAEEVLADYRTAGLSLVAHPLQFLREELGSLGGGSGGRSGHDERRRPVCVAGLVLVRQRPGTAKGITFVTLEDETGVANLIIRLDVWNRYRQVASRAAILLVRGRLQRHGLVIHVLAAKLEDVSDRLHGLDGQSRDFH